MGIVAISDTPFPLFALCRVKLTWPRKKLRRSQKKPAY